MQVVHYRKYRNCDLFYGVIYFFSDIFIVIFHFKLLEFATDGFHKTKYLVQKAITSVSNNVPPMIILCNRVKSFKNTIACVLCVFSTNQENISNIITHKAHYKMSSHWDNPTHIRLTFEYLNGGKRANDNNMVLAV